MYAWRSPVARLSGYLLATTLLAAAAGCGPGDPCDPNPCTGSHRTVCSDQDGTAVCACDDGYVASGSGACVAAPSCEGNTCSGHGTCAVTAGVATCTCDPGYAGLRCDTCAGGHHDDGNGGCVLDESCLPNTCSGHGTCSVTDGVVSCACVSGGYTGTWCQDCASGWHRDATGACVADQTCQGNDCSGHGTCAVSAGVASCACDDGYQGAACDACAPGYHLDGTACVLDQSCLASTCSGHGTCSATDGVVSCACATGYAGTWCQDCASTYHRDAAGACVADQTCQGNDCSGRGTCAVAGGVASCACDDGYAGALCQGCAPGYHVDGSACVLDQTCLATTCSGHGTCVVTAGLVSCSVCATGYTGTWCELCNQGFHRNATGACVPDQTCQGNDCSGHGTCSVVSGLAVCACTAGYSGVACADCAPGFHPAGGACVLDQTCLDTTCSGHGTCVVTGGLVSCSLCTTGYTGTWCELCAQDFHRDAAGACVADESCTGNDCSGHGTCGLVDGRAVCDCATGYSGAACELCAQGFHRDANDACVVDESCDGIDCSGHGTCALVAGLAVCGCQDGYAGADCDACYPGYQVNAITGLCEVPCEGWGPDAIRCQGQCVFGADSSNCGGCGVSCQGAEQCWWDASEPPRCSCPVDPRYDPDCDGLCVYLADDELNCGACGHVCEAGERCLQGRCFVEDAASCEGFGGCDDSNLCCGGMCWDANIFLWDPTNCGGCGVFCGDMACVNGACYGGDSTACDPACQMGMQVCCADPHGMGPACLDGWMLTNDPLNCGACGTVCGENEFCSGGACRCPSDWGDTGFARCNGVCTSLSTEANCGGCGVQCAGAEQCRWNAQGVQCQCPQDLWHAQDCGDGVCVSLAFDEAHCGDCEVSCDASEKCIYNRCYPDSGTCPAGGCSEEELCCNDACLSVGGLLTDPSNCGGCGVVCQGVPCVSGQCYAGDSAACGACGPDGACCANPAGAGPACLSVTELMQDHDNCGECQRACGDSETCVSGYCLCPSEFGEPGWVRCGGVCTQLGTVDNCGGCGDACQGGDLCLDGVCQPDPCQGVSFIGECDGTTLRKCWGRELLVADCAGPNPPGSLGKVCGLADCTGEGCFGHYCVQDLGQACDYNQGVEMHCDLGANIVCVGGICSQSTSCDPATYTPTCSGPVYSYCELGVEFPVDCSQFGAYTCELPAGPGIHPCLATAEATFCGMTDGGLEVRCQAPLFCEDNFCRLPPGIAEARGADDGSGLWPIRNVVVTYIKPAVGSDPAGFFVQAEPAGPALFVQGDPGFLNVGDVVRFDITTMATVADMRRATAIQDLMQVSYVMDLEMLQQKGTWIGDIVTSLDSYECEYMQAELTTTAPFSQAGTGHMGTTVNSGAVFNDPLLRLRLPTTLHDQLVASYGIEQGCSFRVEAPLWRYYDEPQFSAWDAADIQVLGCPAPRVLSAVATGATTIEVTFSRPMDSSSLDAFASQFILDNGLRATLAALTADPRVAIVATGVQNGDAYYTLVVLNSLRDTLGSGVEPDSTVFRGYKEIPCEPNVVISQIYGGGGNSGAPYKNDFIELHNRTGVAVDVSGWSVQYASATGTSWSRTNLVGVIPADGYYLVQQAAGINDAPALPAPDAIGTIAMSGTAGKVALVSVQTALSGGCPNEATIIDFVGFGSTANCFEGPSPTPAPSNTASVLRPGDACVDTDNNGADFVSSAPMPRNSASLVTACLCLAN